MTFAEEAAAGTGAKREEVIEEKYRKDRRAARVELAEEDMVLRWREEDRCTEI